MRLIPGNSLTARLTLLFALASSAVLLALGLVVSSLVEKHFEEQDMEVLSGKVELTRKALSKITDEKSLSGLAQTLDDSLVGHFGMSIAVVGPANELIFATVDGTFPAPLLADGKDTRMAPRVWESHGRPFRGISTRLESGIPSAPPMLVAVSVDISHHRMFMASFSRALWIFVIGAAALTGFLGWVAVRRGLSSLHVMRDKVASVTAQQLHQRLAADAVPGELVELVRTLNEMLGRLEDAFKRLSDFSSDIAHELRTPVSNLMTQTQVTLSRKRSLEEYRSALESNAEEFERLASMISDMLFLAKAENGLVTPNRETVELGDEVCAVCEFMELLGADRGVRIEHAGEGQVVGDRLMLRRALSNFVSNAIQHSADGSCVGVVIEREAESVLVSVFNQGSPIAAEHLDRLFDRFYRVDPSRQRHGEGAGLGLSITRSIVQAHGGEVGARSENGINTFWMRLPAANTHVSARGSVDTAKLAG